MRRKSSFEAASPSAPEAGEVAGGVVADGVAGATSAVGAAGVAGAAGLGGAAGAGSGDACLGSSFAGGGGSAFFGSCFGGGAASLAAAGAPSAAAGFASPPLITATTVFTATVSPSWTFISDSTPEEGAGISASTLSVEISNSGSSRLTESPTCLSHLTMVPSAMDSPICGIFTSSLIVLQSESY